MGVIKKSRLKRGVAHVTPIGRQSRPFQRFPRGSGDAPCGVYEIWEEK